MFLIVWFIMVEVSISMNPVMSSGALAVLDPLEYIACIAGTASGHTKEDMTGGA
jgi:hypothetical protein